MVSPHGVGTLHDGSPGLGLEREAEMVDDMPARKGVSGFWPNRRLRARTRPIPAGLGNREIVVLLLLRGS